MSASLAAAAAPAATTAQLREQAREAANALQWAKAAELYTEAADRYPVRGTPASGSLQARDIQSLRDWAARCRKAAANQKPSTQPAAPVPCTTLEIWVRTRGARRQARWRAPGKTWKPLPVPVADKAQRAGLISIEGFRNAPCVVVFGDEFHSAANVPRETHPAASAFAALARTLNHDIDHLHAAARGAA